MSFLCSISHIFSGVLTFSSHSSCTAMRQIMDVKQSMVGMSLKYPIQILILSNIRISRKDWVLHLIFLFCVTKFAVIELFWFFSLTDRGLVRNLMFTAYFYYIMN